MNTRAVPLVATHPATYQGMKSIKTSVRITKWRDLMQNQVIRINLKGYDHKLIDQSVAQIIETAKRTGARVSGPIPLPTKKEIVTILRAVHKYKDSREQFEMRTHKRVIDIHASTPKTADALGRLDLPEGVDIKVEVK